MMLYDHRNSGFALTIEGNHFTRRMGNGLNNGQPYAGSYYAPNHTTKICPSLAPATLLPVLEWGKGLEREQNVITYLPYAFESGAVLSGQELYGRQKHVDNSPT